jgi:hypothetical protein
VRNSYRSRYSLSTCAAFLMLAACGGSQPPIGAPGAMPQNRAITQHVERGGSWMLPEAKSEDLVYVSSLDNVYVLSYPQLKEVGHLTDAGGFGLCSDTNGNVFAPSYYGGPVIYEYAHGGTSPIARLAEDGDDAPVGCSVDPTTANLAVTNQNGSSCHGNIAIFAGAQGTPTVYCAPTIIGGYIGFCGYDNAGNLYVDGQEGNNQGPFGFVELSKDSTTFMTISINKHINFPGQVQWDDPYVTIEKEFPPKIFAVQISGSTGEVIGTTDLESPKRGAQSWIQNKNILLPFGRHGGSSNVGSWRYPAGGGPTLVRAHFGRSLAGVTVSVAPPLRRSMSARRQQRR